VLALGKDRKAYLLDRNNLGGIGGALVTDTVAESAILGSPVAYPASDGVFVAFAGIGAHCPSAAHGSGITGLKIQSGSPPTMTTGWCGALRGLGSPIVTTTDGRANPTVWIVGAEGDNRLHGFRGDTGEPLVADCYSGPPLCWRRWGYLCLRLLNRRLVVKAHGGPTSGLGGFCAQGSP
jgi:hypothetical protein